ncbi:MAG TPA: ABC transporter ATP-binding protein [Burkholderiales bacterium]|nr:ABC transporter ATP-binding protein [Burkholderiales bacterium]
MLSVRNLSKSFSGPRAKTVLQDISFELAAGDYIAVMGESGIGKSTLLNLIAGLDRPDSGQVLLDGVELSALGDDEATRIRRRHMGFVFQAFHILPYLTVAQNVALPLALNGVGNRAMLERVASLLDAVKLGDRGESLPRELSGGEMQRVAIARALVHRPRLVFADEPTGNLDPESAKEVLALLRECVKEEGAAGILVTHSTAAAKTADRMYLLTEAGLRVPEQAGARGEADRRRGPSDRRGSARR